MKQYYTYAYLRKDRTPYYIGKGKKRHTKYYSRITATHNNISIPPKERIIILKEFEFEFDAYKHEMYMISVLGRKDLGTGILRNRTNGGDGNTNPSEYVRKIISETHKGKILSEETKDKIRKTRLKRNIKVSDELKKHYSKMFTGEGNPNYGKKHSQETRSKISAATKNKNLKTRWYISPEGEIIKVDNLKEFCENKKLNYICMINLHNGYGKTYKGWMKYIDPVCHLF